MYAQLGDIIFEALIGPDQYDDSQETTFAEVPLINSKPKLQRTGEKLQEINLGISLNTAFCSPEEEFKKLNDKRITGEILPFVWGSGDVEGDFVIRSIKKTINALAPSGALRDITLQISLIESYDVDKIGSLKKSAQRNAFATTLTAPTPENIDPPAPTPSADVMADVSVTDRNVNQVNGKLSAAAVKAEAYTAPIDQAQAFVTKVNSEAYQVKKLISGTLTLLAGINVKLGANPALAALVPTLSAQITAADVAIQAADTVVSGYAALPDPVNTLTEANQVLQSMADTKQAVTDMETANKNVKTAAQALAVAMAARKDI